MPSVTLPKGTYWIGNPIDTFPEWEPNRGCSYKTGVRSWYAFKFDASYIAVIPESEMPPPRKRNRKTAMYYMTFANDVVFSEQNGSGFIDKIVL